MKKMLLTLSLVVSPLVAMEAGCGDEKLQEKGVPIIDVMKELPMYSVYEVIKSDEWQEAKQFLRSNPDESGRYDTLFQRMAEETATFILCRMGSLVTCFEDNVNKKGNAEEKAVAQKSIGAMRAQFSDPAYRAEWVSRMAETIKSLAVDPQGP